MKYKTDGNMVVLAMRRQYTAGKSAESYGGAKGRPSELVYTKRIICSNNITEKYQILPATRFLIFPQ